jgi:hypothetical protein
LALASARCLDLTYRIERRRDAGIGQHLVTANEPQLAAPLISTVAADEVNMTFPFLAFCMTRRTARSPDG